MRFEQFIASKFMPRGERGGFAASLSVIAVVSIALGVTVMVMAVCILRGFQRDISDKVSGFGSHITVTSYAKEGGYEAAPLRMDMVLASRLRSVDGIRHLQYFADKGGMVKTADQIEGIVFRGMSAGYDTTFFATYLTEGRLPRLVGETSNDVIISQSFARKMRIGMGDKMRTYFWQGQTYRSRAFTVCGIYNTDLAEMDAVYAVGDLRQVQRLNDWDSTQAGGIELLVTDFDRLDATARRVADELPYDLNLTTIVQQNPALFSWLDLLNSNITLILVIMSIVCAIAITSALLIMIFEKSRTIGILKTLGASNASVRRIFMLKAGKLIAAGVLIGDAASLTLCLLQQQFNIVKLDPESYSMTHVPVEIDGWLIAIISLATMAVCVTAMLLPASYISRIRPAETIRVEK